MEVKESVKDNVQPGPSYRNHRLQPGTSGYSPAEKQGHRQHGNDRLTEQQETRTTPIIHQEEPRNIKSRLGITFRNKRPYSMIGSNQYNFDNKRYKRSESSTNASGSDRFSNRSFENNQKEELRTLGFITLEKLSLTDSKDILVKVNEKQKAFFNLLKTPIEKPDMFVLIMEIIAKVCQSPFEQLKLSFILDVCNSQFIVYLRSYVMDLHYDENKKANGKYWQNQESFWNNFVVFCETIMCMSPSTAAKRCRSLIEDTSKHCLEKLDEKHGFKLSEEINLRLLNVRESLTNYSKEPEVGSKGKGFTNKNIAPPENFRELSIIPTRTELLEVRPFLRPNIVNGAYTDVEHYLDVQFRLLREDCFGPLRDGINQFIKEPTKRKYDHIRVYRNVTFMGPYVSNNVIGTVVEMEESVKRRFKNINWAHNKRFIFGSLVLFTNDNFKNFIVATILDRDIKELSRGKIPISIVDLTVGDEIYQSRYTMIESEVYYEPYSHVLKALQDTNFPNEIAMKKYIIDVDATPHPPAYVNEDTVCKANMDLMKKEFCILDFNSWPTSEELNFNESQYEAYKVALTHEFGVIQGPPGTGKTYLGVNIAKTMLNMSIKSETNCVLLLICYTNHALDQFLEALLPVTQSIVRIGGQSRNKILDQYNLNALRKQRPGRASGIFYSQKDEVRSSLLHLKTLHTLIDSLNTVILSSNYMQDFIPYINVIKEHYEDYGPYAEDALINWLFQNIFYNYDENVVEVYANNEEDSNYCLIDIQTDGIRNVILDNFDIDNNDFQKYLDFRCSFSLNNAKREVNNYVNEFNNERNRTNRNLIFNKIIVLRARIRLFTEMAKYYQENDVNGLDLNQLEDPSALGTVQRWMIYFNWVNTVRRELKKQLVETSAQLRKVNERYQEARMLVDFELIKEAEVVGMTTSGAARLRKLLQNLSPPIVIVEEAAEVLEQHIITSLTNHCQHLILIGDHQQLRPSAAHMKLAKHFNMEVSLFERMIKNGIHSRRLRVQHRMRPDIAALISPHIYPDLLNHPSVSNFPNVRGITKNVFFFSHKYQEEAQEDGVSKVNKKEGDMVLHLANYIMNQGYKPEDVTILATYSGQMFYMRKERNRYFRLSNVKITVVDNYQGEESKIILLSLVRNNDRDEIGFLKTENRICVMLSRAREGFYMFGNMDILKKNSELWTKISQTLESKGFLGTTLVLKCENHQDQNTNISSTEDFDKVPEGGCKLICNYNLPCLHNCELVCHGYDKEHKALKCRKKCERIICENNHVCPLMCATKCRPCHILIMKELPCGHSRKIACYKDPKDVNCEVLVEVKLPSCGHVTKKPCFMTDVEFVECPFPCELRVDKCGHACLRKCHVKDDPRHEKYLCNKRCNRLKKGCTMDKDKASDDHRCMKKCYEKCITCNVEVRKQRKNCKHTKSVACSEDVDKTRCHKRCGRKLQCGHYCQKECYEKCTNCSARTIITKKIPECGHEVQLECRIEPIRKLCTHACERKLSCGHNCTDACKNVCNADNCMVIIPEQFTSPCGHNVSLPCSIYHKYLSMVELQEAGHGKVLMKWCTSACTAVLACGHVCGGSCGDCLLGRLHRACDKRCERINICGHLCEEPCNQICPPCKRKCEVKCEHSRCNKVCGETCVPCQEPCVRRCPHSSCRRRCGEACGRAACDEPCGRARPCAHPCRGLCGERCPDICKLCDPEHFPTDFLGDEFDDDAKFIILEDCGHIIEVETMDASINSEKDSIMIPSCPLCRKPIVNTPRYKDLIIHKFKTEINPVKERIYGSSSKRYVKKKQLLTKVRELKTIRCRDRCWSETFFSLFHKFLKNMKYDCLLKLQTYEVLLEVLKMLAIIYTNFEKYKAEELEEAFTEQFSILCKFILDNLKKFSEQHQIDIKKEIKRLNAIGNLSKILNHPSYISTKSSAEVNEVVESAKAQILCWEIFDEEKSNDLLSKIQKAVKASGIINKEERDLIVKAIGLRPGHWYKCPNGHFYCIGECGGAMQISKCPECKEDIGGERHNLLNTNRHAPEMDGSRFPSWSEQANMANFNLDNVL